MSKAGQNTVTGISVQADISLLKLLESFHESGFEEILLEDKNWEDFTLIFGNRVESFEVKWHKDPLSYYEVRSIIRKEVKKTQTKDYSFKIVAQSFSTQFKKDFEELKRILPYLEISRGNRPFTRNPTVKKFIKDKRWTKEEVNFIRNTELISLETTRQISDRIYDLFRYQWDVFLTDTDLRSLVSVCFREILEKAQVGSSISLTQFALLVSEFEESLARKSESFTPTISTATQTKNLEKFLTSPTEFKKLDNEAYLTPLTHKKNRALITYISKKLEANTFSASDIEFFIQKVLLKNSYLYTCIKLLEMKSEAGLMDAKYYIEFICKNFHKLGNDYIVHDALKLLLSSLKSAPEMSPQVLKFLQNSIFPKDRIYDYLQRADLDYSYKFEHVPQIVEVLGNELQHSEEFINILFQAFDFTGDQFQLPTDTPVQVYATIKMFLSLDVGRRWSKIIDKVGAQYFQKYNLPFKGYEHSGGGVGMSGWHFSFTDTGIVRRLYGPFFRDLLVTDSSKFIKFLNQKVFFDGSKISGSNPVYIKRAAIAPLVEFISKSMGTPDELAMAKKMIKHAVQIDRGIPNTRDALFAFLRGGDLKTVGHEFVLELIKIDIKKSLHSIPTSIFVLETALKLIDEGCEEADELLKEILKKPQFMSSWRAKEFLSVLGNPDIFKTNQTKKIELIESFDIKAYLKQEHVSDWLNSDFVKNHLQELIKIDADRANIFLTDLLSDKVPSEKILNLLSGAFFHLFLESPQFFWQFFEDEIRDKNKFHSRFKKSSNFRQTFSRLAQAMISKGDLEAAKKIVLLLIHDPDPNTNKNKKKNEELKNGGSSSVIHGVRTQVPWIVQQFAIKKDVSSLKYALKMSKLMLDLNGNLQRTLGYTDRDYYVLANAIIPLIELAHPYRRKLLKEADGNKRDNVKGVALQLLKVLKTEIDDKKIKPVGVCDYLVNVFFNIRDLNTNEAANVLDVFEKVGVEESVILVIYFAIFRKAQFKNIPFDAKPFKMRLSRLCQEHTDFSSRLAWQLWQTLKDPNVPQNKINEIDNYIEVLFRVPRPKEIGILSYILEDALQSPKRYQRYFILMKLVVIGEIDYLLKTSGSDRYPRLSFRKIAPILRENSIRDFFEIFEIVIKYSDPKTGIGVYGFNLQPLIDEFKKLGEIPSELFQRHEQIRRFLLGIGAIE